MHDHNKYLWFFMIYMYDPQFDKMYIIMNIILTMDNSIIYGPKTINQTIMKIMYIWYDLLSPRNTY